jgi:hypothetical protein
MSIVINVTKSEDDISCIKIPEIKKPEQNLIEYHNKLGSDFIKKIDITSVTEKIDLKLISRKPYQVTDRKNALLNSETNFSKVNELIKIHLRKRDFLTIDKEKALDEIDRIESRSKKSSNNSLLNF